MSEIRIRGIRVLRGASVWAHQPVVEAHIDIGSFEERPTNKIEGFTDRLVEAMPTLYEHRCSEGRRGGFISRMREGTWIGHVAEHVSIELLNLAGMEVSYGKTRSERGDHPGEYRVVIEYEEEESGKRSIELAVEGCQALAGGKAHDFAPAVEELRALAERGMLDPVTQALLAEARRRNIPWIRRDGEKSIQLGYGKMQKRVDGKAVPGASGLSESDLRKRAEAVVEGLFPNGEAGRILIIAITGTSGKTSVARMVASIMQTAGYFVGLACSDGVYYNGERAYTGDSSGADGAERVLMHSEVEAAVLEVSVGGILDTGLAFDVCDVGVVLNVLEDHLDLSGVYSVEDLALVKGVVIESVRRSGYGVLNADDPLVADMEWDCDGEVIFFSQNPENPRLTEHLEDASMGVVLADGWIVLRGGAQQTRLVEWKDVSAGGSLRVDNVLAAVAAAWGAGVPVGVIARAL